MSISDSSLRNLTTNDFIFNNASQAAEFWLIAYDAFEYFRSKNDDQRMSIIFELKRKYPDRTTLDNLALAATNSSVTDAIKWFLPQEYSTASHDWLCGQFQKRGIPSYFLDRISGIAEVELCHDINIDEQLLALGSFPTILIYAIVFSLSVTSVLIYLIHAARNGPRRTVPEIVKDSSEAKDKLQGIEPLTSLALSNPALQYSNWFVDMAGAWLSTIGFTFGYTMIWYIFGNPNTRLVYNVAFVSLATRISLCTIGCSLPLAYKFFELRSFVQGHSSAWLLYCHGVCIMLTDLYIVGAYGEIIDRQNLFYRDRPCAEQYFGSSLGWTRFLIGLRYEVLLGMGVLYGIVRGLLPKIFPKLKDEKNQQLHYVLGRVWSYIHPLKVWVVIELISLAQAVYAGWSIRTKIIGDGLYANFHTYKFGGYGFLLILLCALAAELASLIIMDLRVRWKTEVIWSKAQETVDGSEEVLDVEMETIAANKL